MQFQWALHNLLFNSHENYQLYTIEVIERTNVPIMFANIRTPKSTYYLLHDKSHSKTHATIMPFSASLQILASPAKK